MSAAPYDARSPPSPRSPCNSFTLLPVTLANFELDERTHHDVHIYISNCSLGIDDHQLSWDPDCLYRQPEKGIIPLVQVIEAEPPFRSLTSAIKYDDEMTALASQPPGSPPGLTESRSSKSSSLHSSSLSGTNAVLFDITNFEEIGLEEGRHSNLDDSDKRPLSVAATIMKAQGSTGNHLIMANTRELTNGATRPPYPNLHSQIRGIAASPPLGLPKRVMGKRGFGSSSTPTLAMTAMNNLTRSRSPSPSHPSAPASASSAFIPRRASLQPQGLPAETHMLPKRRGSWQPNRKTVKELEDEYNDLDEDLPEDASLWNVPLSPRPLTERTSASVARSAQTSPGTSPERADPLGSPGGLDGLSRSHPGHSRRAVSMSHVPSVSLDSAKSAAMMRPKFPPHGAPANTLPDHSHFSANRSKSWNVALSELSEEVQDLTEALEIHAGTLEGQQEGAVGSSKSSSQRSAERLSRATTSPLELPPLRTSDMMIDPLPISKEKEKVLSRTRPSWLPPKDRKEEKKHLKQYQRIMQLSLDADKKKAAQAADRQCAQDDTKNALSRIWEEHVLPNWDQVIREPRTRELWWRGVAPSSRAKVWERAVGNELALTDGTFFKALQRAQQLDSQMSQARPDERLKEKTWFRAIRRDIKTVFPELKIFQPGGPLHDGLLDVLMAYSMYRSDVGYCHGTHLIAALLFLILPNPSSTFRTLANLLNRPLLMAFLTGDPSSIEKTYNVVMSLVSFKFPRLHAHLFTSSGLNLASHEVLEPMIRTLFLGPGEGLGIEIASRVWDIMMFDGDAAVVRAAAAVLGGLEGKLYGNREEVLRVLGWGGIGWAGCYGNRVEEFMRGLRSVGKEDKGRNKKNPVK